LSVKNLLLLICLVFGLGVSSIAQTPAPKPASSVDEKSQKIIDHAIEVLGGQTYLNVQTVIGRGFYSEFKEGMPQVPSKFIDYIAYPNRERTEFINSGIKIIQTNSGETGWMFDGAIKKISDQTPAQVEEFKRTMRTGIENLLHGWWRNEGGKVTYVGRREAGLAKRNEVIRLTYVSGFWVEYEFGAKDGLPAKIIYKRMRRDPDSGDEVETTEEDQLLKFISNEGVTAPWVIDHFVNGHQTSRINYESVQYNQKIPDALFAKPDNVKAIK
jgi:outer membrane lipoprotein-sorting protein